METARRLFMLGYDGMNYQLLKRFLAEGSLPAFQSLLDRGSLNRLLCAIPAWTPTNWSTLVTGTSAGGHRTANWNIRDSTDPDAATIPCWKHSAYGGAETIWEVAEEAGLRSLITHFPPGSFDAVPGGFVAGAGLAGAPASYAGSERYDVNREGASDTHTAVLLEPATAAGWSNTGDGDEGACLTIGKDKQDAIYLLKRGDGRVLICSDSDPAAMAADLQLRQWSDPVICQVGPDRQEAAMRFRLMEAVDGRLDLWRSAVTFLRGHAQPAELGEELLQHCGPFFEPSPMIDEPDDDVLMAWLEQMRIQAEWEIDVARHVQRTRGWELHFCHWHPFDWINHASINKLDPNGPNYDQSHAEWYLSAQRQTYQLGDDILRQFLELEQEGDLIVVVADHGMAPAHRSGFLPERLKEVGLSVAGEGGGGVELSRSVGHWGYNCGDVVYAMNRGFGWSLPAEGGAVGSARDGEHASQIPTSEAPEATNLGCCLMAGPGVKAGYERDWQRWGLMRMVDMAPTLAATLGIRAPRHNTGAVLGDLFE